MPTQRSKSFEAASVLGWLVEDMNVSLWEGNHNVLGCEAFVYLAVQSIENPSAEERLNHLGVEVFADPEVRAATERLKSAGLAELVEDEQTCCYATQNKVWALDPQGMRWEWYRVIEDSESFAGSSAEPVAQQP